MLPLVGGRVRRRTESRASQHPKLCNGGRTEIGTDFLDIARTWGTRRITSTHAESQAESRPRNKALLRNEMNLTITYPFGLRKGTENTEQTFSGDCKGKGELDASQAHTPKARPKHDPEKRPSFAMRLMQHSVIPWFVLYASAAAPAHGAKTHRARANTRRAHRQPTALRRQARREQRRHWPPPPPSLQLSPSARSLWLPPLPSPRHGSP